MKPFCALTGKRCLEGKFHLFTVNCPSPFFFYKNSTEVLFEGFHRNLDFRFIESLIYKEKKRYFSKTPIQMSQIFVLKRHRQPSGTIFSFFLFEVAASWLAKSKTFPI